MGYSHMRGNSRLAGGGGPSPSAYDLSRQYSTRCRHHRQQRMLWGAEWPTQQQQQQHQQQCM